MKYSIFFFLLLVIYSCKSDKVEVLTNTSQVVAPTEKDSTRSTILTNDSIIKDEQFVKYDIKAVLIGKKIELLDENNTLLKDISNLQGKIISVLSISNKINHYNGNKDCNEFKWVKVKIGEKIGYIDGNYLYELINHKQNQKLKFGLDEISLTVTKTMGQRENDETGDPLYCYSDKPIIFKDKEAKFEGLVETIKNEYSEHNNHYFALFDDDGAGDEVINVEKKDNKYIFTIQRIYQEDGANMTVEIYKKQDGKFVAEITTYKKIDEQEL